MNDTNDTNDTNDNNNNDARGTIERYGYERYGMNDTNDNRRHRHPTPVIYDTSHTITSRRYKHFLPLVQLAAETSVLTKLVPPYRILMFVCEFNYHIRSRR